MLIVCNGMIRAGSTLQYNVVRSLIEKMRVGAGQGFFHPPNLSNFDEQIKRLAQDKRYHVIKMHPIYPKSAEMLEIGSMKICYIYRDIRDVALSVKRKFGYKGKALLKALDRAVSTYYEMKTLQGVLWQKYENAIRDLATSVREIADYLDLDPTENVIASVTKDCSLESALTGVENISMNVKVKHFIYRNVKPHIDKQSKRVPANIKYILKNSGISSLVHYLTSPKYIYDKNTILHPDHISKDAGAEGAWRRGLDKQDSNAVTARYKGWLFDAGYIE